MALGLELQMGMSYHVDSENQSLVFYKSSKYSHLPSQLSGLCAHRCALGESAMFSFKEKNAKPPFHQKATGTFFLA